MFWFSLKSLKMCQGNTTRVINGETHRQGFKLPELFLDCFFVVESQIVREHTADFLLAVVFSVKSPICTRRASANLLVRSGLLCLLHEFLNILKVHLLVYLLQNLAPRLEPVQHRYLYEGELYRRNLCVTRGSVSWLQTYRKWTNQLLELLQLSICFGQ